MLHKFSKLQLIQFHKLRIFNMKSRKFCWIYNFINVLKCYNILSFYNKIKYFDIMFIRKEKVRKLQLMPSRSESNKKYRKKQHHNQRLYYQHLELFCECF